MTELIPVWRFILGCLFLASGMIIGAERNIVVGCLLVFIGSVVLVIGVG